MTTKKTIVAMLSALLAGMIGLAAVLALFLAVAGLLGDGNERTVSIPQWVAISTGIPLGFGLGLLVWIPIVRKLNWLSWEEIDRVLGVKGRGIQDE
jgi:hypothetical protein